MPKTFERRKAHERRRSDSRGTPDRTGSADLSAWLLSRSQQFDAGPRSSNAGAAEILPEGVCEVRQRLYGWHLRLARAFLTLSPDQEARFQAWQSESPRSG